jgi:hypothetical protein
MLRGVFHRDPDLNYKGISSIYSIACVASIALYTLEEFGSRPQTKWVANLNGVYIAFAPFGPCLLWVLLMQVFQPKQVSTTTNNDDKKDQ